MILYPDEATVTTIHPILVADDDPVVRRVITRIVANVAPHRRIVEAATTTEARHLLRRWRWSAILTDYDMPDATSIQLIIDARALDPGVPIVVISAHQSVAQQVLDIGATHFVAKPFSVEALRALIEHVLNNRP